MMNWKELAQIAGTLLLGLSATAETVDLAGKWSVELPGGEKKELKLPGSLTDAKIGPVPKKPFRGTLTPRYQYIGKGTYTKTIVLSEDLKEDHEIFLERVMWKSTLRFDGKEVGSRDSLTVPHVYRIPASLLTKGTHTISVEIDNTEIVHIGQHGHVYGDSMQTRWHGMIGKLLLREVNPLRDAQVYAPLGDQVTVRFPKAINGVTAEIEGVSGTTKTISQPTDSFTLRVPGAQPWSDSSPKLYTLVLKMQGKEDHRIRFGFRTFERRGNKLFLNGKPLFLRSNLDCCHFPLTGYPAMDKNSWREIFTILRKEGVNQIRFHSWCPPQAAFEAGDEMGLLLAPEILWIDGWMGIPGVGQGNAAVDAWVHSELLNQSKTYGNSPSFFLSGIGNELGNSNYQVMQKWVEDLKTKDPRRLYFLSTARQITSADDLTITHSYPGIGWVRQRSKEGTDWDYEDVYGRTRVPTIAHEIGQWPVFPDYKHELPKYTGTLRAWNLENSQKELEKLGMGYLNSAFTKSSLWLNRLKYKEEIESFLRTPSCAGIALLSVQDYSGQGEALVGWLDSFYDPKPGVEKLPPASTFFAPTVCLARFPKFTWITDETFIAGLVVRNMKQEAIPVGTEIPWSFGKKNGTIRLSEAVPYGAVKQVGKLSIPLAKCGAPQRMNLKFGNNSWPIWVYPAEVSTRIPKNVMYVTGLESAQKAIQKGARVLLNASFLGTPQNSFQMSFNPVYWSAVWFGGNKNPTLGMLIKNQSPAFNGFPTEDWQDWQWRNLIQGGRSFRFAKGQFPNGLLVMPIPDFHRPFRAGTIVEMKVGNASVLACGFDLDKDIPEARQLKRSLLDYVASSAFAPKDTLAISDFKKMFADPRSAVSPRPKEFKKAVVYMEAARFLQHKNRDVSWNRHNDRVELTSGSYELSGDHLRTWADSDGKYWVGSSIRLVLKDIPPTKGIIMIRFRDPNHLSRTAKGTFEHSSFTIPKHDQNPNGSYWLKFPIEREDALDGQLVFEVKSLSGPNTMIDRVVVLPE